MFVTVALADFENFMEAVNPECRFDCFYYKGDLEIEFSSPEDYENAQKWVYENYGESLYIDGKYYGGVSYSEDKSFYWDCTINDVNKTGFETPNEALESFEKYVEELRASEI